jgi:gas vesicle protein
LLKDRGMVEFSIEQLDRYMQNIGEKQFSYDTFKAAYDTDPRIQELVTDFNDETISLKDSEMDDLKASKKQSKDDVSSMAKRATKVGAKL